MKDYTQKVTLLKEISEQLENETLKQINKAIRDDQMAREL